MTFNFKFLKLIFDIISGLFRVFRFPPARFLRLFKTLILGHFPVLLHQLESRDIWQDPVPNVRPYSWIWNVFGFNVMDSRIRHLLHLKPKRQFEGCK